MPILAWSYVLVEFEGEVKNKGPRWDVREVAEGYEWYLGCQCK